MRNSMKFKEALADAIWEQTGEMYTRPAVELARKQADAVLNFLKQEDYVVAKLPAPGHVGTYGEVWSTDDRYDGPIGTVQYRPDSGRIEIRDDYDHDYEPRDVERDALVLLAAVRASERNSQQRSDRNRHEP